MYHHSSDIQSVFRRDIKKSLDNYENGILLNGERLNNIRSADDIVIFGGSIEGLQQLTDKVYEVSER